jgi:excisionase family DNA binding protein
VNDVLDEIEAAELFDCEPSTIQEKARNGELPGVKIGRSWRFPRTALLEVLHTKALANMQPKKEPFCALLPAGSRQHCLR